MSRIFIDAPPFPLSDGAPWERGLWPASWIRLADPDFKTGVVVYRLRFTLEKAASVRLHVSADERYRLFLDGEDIGQGPERGDLMNWFYESYEVEIPAGEHTLAARVWTMGELKPYAQISSFHSFILAAEDPHTEVLSTGHAAWEARRIPGIELVPPGWAWGTGANVRVDGRHYPWGCENGHGDDWAPAETLEQAGDTSMYRVDTDSEHLLRPAMLPAMIAEPYTGGRVRFIEAVDTDDLAGRRVEEAQHIPDEVDAWQALLDGQPVSVPANTRRRVIIDLDEYLCAYPFVTLTGGRDATVRLLWSEALFEDLSNPDMQPDFIFDRSKGQRDEVANKFFVGYGDTFIADGGEQRRFDTLWWQSGRFVEVYVHTGEEPLTIESLQLVETRYPLEMESRFSSSDAAHEDMTPILLRGLQMCSHETYFDCPHYEQMMYTGDTRVEALTTFAISRDTRLPRKALEMFHASRLPEGFTQARYPSWSLSLIPSFSLWWVAMIYDYALWRGGADEIRVLLPAARDVLDSHWLEKEESGLLRCPRGWSFVDWVDEWYAGTPPGGKEAVSTVINWQAVWVSENLAALERAYGEPEAAALYSRRARELADALHEQAWDEGRGMFADVPGGDTCSEHAQVLAILSGHLDPAREARLADALANGEPDSQTTIYFSHYLFEAAQKTGRIDIFLDRLDLWKQLQPAGYKTTFEAPGKTRSDCHGWGAHPLYQFLTGILGIRPSAFGFDHVTIRPQLGSLSEASGALVHPAGGDIQAEVRRVGDQLEAAITLPPGLSGTLIAPDGAEHALTPGRQTLTVPG